MFSRAPLAAQACCTRVAAPPAVRYIADQISDVDSRLIACAFTQLRSPLKLTPRAFLKGTNLPLPRYTHQIFGPETFVEYGKTLLVSTLAGTVVEAPRSGKGDLKPVFFTPAAVVRLGG